MKMKPCENFRKMRSPKKVVLSSDFAGVKAGQTLYIGTPQIIADYISAIPLGQTASINKMRNQLARRHKCDAMCPASTAIFTRIVAEYALEEISEGKSVSEVIPFWRVVESSDKLAKKLPIDSAWIDEQRNLEAIA